MGKWIFFCCGLLALPLAVWGQPAGRTEVPLEQARESVVLFTFGQSNSANHGQGHYKCWGEVYNYCDGKLYRAEDPLLGASGGGGSVWGRVGDLMIESGMAERVTIVPVGVGGVRVGAWAEGGELYEKLVSTVERLANEKVRIDYICWHQGETDNILNTPKEEYIRLFETIRRVFRERGVDAPILIAEATYHPDCIEQDFGISTEIREAQRELVRKYGDLFAGPDTDRLDKAYHRSDGVHFSTLGQDAHARMWVEAIGKLKN